MTPPRCTIVAELSCNHHGSLERALALVHACKQAGADAIKLQTWTPGKMTLNRSYVLRNGPWVGTNLYELYEKAHTPWEWHQEIYNTAHRLRMEAFSSVFDTEALAMLEQLGCPRYKIASFELVDTPLIRAVAETRKPMILSTGMASRTEIEDAVQAARQGGCKDLTLLRCVSAYPATGASANLASLRTMRDQWLCKVGLSDHTRGIGVAVVAAAMGATMIEKHVTASRDEGGPDAGFSIEPQELHALVDEVRETEACWGSGHVYGPTHHEMPQVALRRSLYFTRDIPAGTVLERRHLTTARPADGLEPRHGWRLVGLKLRHDVRAGQPVQWDNVVLPSQHETGKALDLREKGVLERE